MAEKNSNYRNFSNRCSFNGQPFRADEELVPAVLSTEMITTLLPMGLNYDNVETWTFPYGKKVPIVFIPYRKGFMDVYMRIFNDDVERYLKHKYAPSSIDLPLDEFIEKANTKYSHGFDPTGTTDNEDIAFLMMTIKDLIAKVSKKYPEAENILNLLLNGYQKNEIFEKVNLGRGKSQSYAFIDKIQTYAKEMYYNRYL